MTDEAYLVVHVVIVVVVMVCLAGLVKAAIGGDDWPDGWA